MTIEREDVMLGTYVEYDSNQERTLTKQKNTDLVLNTVTINGKEATTVSGAQKILTALAKEIAQEHADEEEYKNYTAREYSRFTVHRMLANNNIEAVRTTSANFYYIEDLYRLKDKLRPARGTRTGVTHYSPDKKREAIQLSQEGVSNRQIALQIGVSYQTVNNWIKKNKQIS